MKTTHTPAFTKAPWRWQGTKRSPKSYAYILDSENNVVLAHTEGLDLTEANAALIVAAPELLTAYGKLHDMLSEMIESGRLKESDIPDDYRAVVEQLAGPCNAAAAKAEGRA